MQNDPYAKLAGRYDRSVEPAASMLRKVGLKIFPPRDGIAMLDVGCGTGTQLGLYARPGCRLVGIDPSPAMLAMARQKLGSRAELRQEDATRMSFADGTFDLVTVVLVLHEMRPEVRTQVLRECRRVTKSDGRILFIDFHYGPYSFLKGWLYKAFIIWAELGAGREHFSNYRYFLSHRGLDSLVEEAHAPVVRRLVLETGTAAIYLLSP